MKPLHQRRPFSTLYQKLIKKYPAFTPELKAAFNILLPVFLGIIYIKTGTWMYTSAQNLLHFQDSVTSTVLAYIFVIIPLYCFLAASACFTSLMLLSEEAKSEKYPHMKVLGTVIPFLVAYKLIEWMDGAILKAFGGPFAGSLGYSLSVISFFCVIAFLSLILLTGRLTTSVDS